MEINFDLPPEDFDTVCEIADRADASGLTHPDRYSRITLIMDLCACHNHATPLDFKRLSEADGLNFNHDIAGIARHMDRETGQLRDCFVPRFAKRD